MLSELVDVLAQRGAQVFCTSFIYMTLFCFAFDMFCLKFPFIYFFFFPYRFPLELLGHGLVCIMPIWDSCSFWCLVVEAEAEANAVFMRLILHLGALF